MSPFWRAVLVGLVVVAVVLLADVYERTLRGLASTGWAARQALFGWRDVRGIQWLLGIGASLLIAAVLFAILVTALPAPRNAQLEATQEPTQGSKETSSRAQELPQGSDRVAHALAEARETRDREQRVSQ